VFVFGPDPSVGSMISPRISGIRIQWSEAKLINVLAEVKPRGSHFGRSSGYLFNSAKKQPSPYLHSSFGLILVNSIQLLKTMQMLDQKWLAVYLGNIFGITQRKC